MGDILYIEEIWNYTACVRILVIILAITSLDHGHYYHSARPWLSPSLSLRSAIIIIITPLSHGSNHSHPMKATIAATMKATIAATIAIP